MVLRPWWQKVDNYSYDEVIKNWDESDMAMEQMIFMEMNQIDIEFSQ